jgi:nucleotide-binding universal stress UspA family protein
MMAENHPNELDLLAYAEGDLERVRRDAVSAHLETCPACAETVGRLELGREALRSAPMLELPARARAEILAGLLAPSPKRRVPVGRLAVLLAVVALLAGLTTAVVVSRPGETSEEGAAPAAEQAPAATATRETAGGEADRTPTVRKVKGPPAEVARLLRRQGYDATVAGSRVEVRNASEAEVRRALAGRPGGLVPVVIP